MKIFYILLTDIVLLALSPNKMTTLHFDSEVIYCDHGHSKNEMIMEKRRSNFSRAFLPHKIRKGTIMVCYLKDGDIKHFKLIQNNSPHISVNVKNAEAKKGNKLLYQGKDFKIFDAPKNLYIKSKRKITVNNKVMEGEGFSSKWFPIEIDGKEIRL